MTGEFILKCFFTVSMFVALSATTAFAQGTGFSFQGRLNDGTNPANGRYDLQFRLYDAVTGGNPIGALISRPATILINGVFSVTLDFGATAFNNPNSIFIEIGVKPANSPNAYTILGPRQQLTVVPFAVRANNATNADNATNAQNAVNATNAVTATNALSLGGVAATEYARLNTTNTGDLRATGNLMLVGNGLGSDGNLSMSGDLTLTGSGSVIATGGNLNIVGNAKQNVSSNGFVKAMIYVNANGTILRCYNGITNSSSGNCGFTAGRGTYSYQINFGFRVFDRFVTVTPITAASVNIVTSFQYLNSSFPNEINVYTNITDVDHDLSYTPNPFMVIVY